MTYQAYLDTIKAKTGKAPDDFRALAAKKGLTQYGEIMTWLKSDYGLGHGHANAIAQLIVHHDAPHVTPDNKIAQLFAGNKEKWRKPYDALLTKLTKFGKDVTVSSTDTYISLLRGGKKFGIVQISTERLDIGIKLKGAPPTDRLEAAGKWNAMVTHHPVHDHGRRCRTARSVVRHGSRSGPGTLVYNFRCDRADCHLAGYALLCLSSLVQELSRAGVGARL